MAAKGNVQGAKLSAVETDWVDVNLSLLGARRPDLDLSGSDVTARIFRLREIFVKALDNVHGQFGLKPRMFLVLAALYRSGQPYALSPASLMRYLMWTSAGLSQLLDRMASADLIRRQPDPNHGRGVLVALSPEGKRVIAAVLAMHCGAELRLIAALKEPERRTLVALLRKLLIAAEGPQLPRGDGAIAPRRGRARAKACVPGMARNSSGESPDARYRRSRRLGEGQGRRREAGSEGSPIRKRGARYTNRI